MLQYKWLYGARHPHDGDVVQWVWSAEFFVQSTVDFSPPCHAVHAGRALILSPDGAKSNPFVDGCVHDNADTPQTQQCE